MLPIIKYCFLKTMANIIPFFGFNIFLCFYPLKGKKSIRRAFFGFNRAFSEIKTPAEAGVKLIFPNKLNQLKATLKT